MLKKLKNCLEEKLEAKGAGRSSAGCLPIRIFDDVPSPMKRIKYLAKDLLLKRKKAQTVI
jgi:hypothetical protein